MAKNSVNFKIEALILENVAIIMQIICEKDGFCRSWVTEF